jgi:hypothetical protein
VESPRDVIEPIRQPDVEPELGPGVVPLKVIDGFMRHEGDQFVIYYKILLSDGTTRVFSSADARKLKKSIIVDYLLETFDLGICCYYTAFGKCS